MKKTLEAAPKKTTKKTTPKECPSFLCEVGDIFKGIFRGIINIIKGIFAVIYGILRFVQSLIRSIFVFILGYIAAISLLLISITLSVFLLASAIGLKDSPTFQKYRELALHMLFTEDTIAIQKNIDAEQLPRSQ